MLKAITRAIYLLVFFLYGEYAPLLAGEEGQIQISREGQGDLRDIQSQLVLHVKGSPYEMGYQHGKLLKNLVQKNVSEFIEKSNPAFNADPALKARFQAFQEHFSKLYSYIPERFQEEMKGLADGSGIALQKIIALNTFPELFHCIGVAVSEDATKDGALYHTRVLDYSVGKNLQNTAVLMVVEPQEGYAFTNVTYAGFIGSVTGMNEKQIAMGEIGGWGYGHWNGMPMSFLFREILEKASSLEEAKQHLAKTPRTCEYYYVISDGKNNQSIGVYATESQIHFIDPGASYALLAPNNLPANYGINGDHDKFCLSPCVLKITPYQTLLYDSDDRVAMLFHEQPKNSLLMTGFSHPERYPLLMNRVLSHYGKIDEVVLQEIIKCPVARESNLHNVIFLPSQLKMWIAHAGPNNEPACEQPYKVFSLSELLDLLRN